jgi:hypothetical protein
MGFREAKERQNNQIKKSNKRTMQINCSLLNFNG